MPQQKKEQKLNLELIVRIREIEERWAFLGNLFGGLFKWGVLAFGFWCIRDAWIGTAGTMTSADFRAAFRFETVSSAADTLLVVFGFGGILFGRQQMRLKRQAIKRLESYARLYEEVFDKDRTSSDLMNDGSTREEDR